MPQPRILFVLPRLVSGGVERVTLHLIRMLRADGIACALVLGRRHGELLDEADALVDVHELAPHGWHLFVPRLKRLIEAWRPTHVVTAFADVGLMTAWALALSRHEASLIHGVHDTLGAAAARPGWTGRARHWVHGLLARLVFRQADAIVAVSDGVRGEVVQRLAQPPPPVYRIYNPVIPDASRRAGFGTPRSQGDPLKIVALGRLVHQKGFDVLIDALAEMAVSRPWSLDIYGEGPMRQALADRIRDKGLQSRVALRGLTTDPFGTLAEYELLVMPSRHEGLGNVLVEAMSCGLQVIAADCPHGPREILQDGRLGALVPPEDSTALASAITAYAEGKTHIDVDALVARSREFTVEAAYRAWRAVFDEAHVSFAKPGDARS